jgi:hypothetical protein
LSQLKRNQGKTREARQRLMKICNQFPEESDLVDLEEAKALLAELT